MRDDWYFQMYYDDLPVWGFIGKVEKIIQKSGVAEYKYYVFTHVDFDIKYQGDRVIEINVLTDPHQVRAAAALCCRRGASRRADGPCAAPSRPRLPVLAAPGPGGLTRRRRRALRLPSPGGGHQRERGRGQGQVQLQRQVDAHHHLL